MSQTTERVRVELTRSGDAPLNAQSLCEWLYRTEVVRGTPEVYRVEIEVGAEGLRSLEALPGLTVEALDTEPRRT